MMWLYFYNILKNEKIIEMKIPSVVARSWGLGKVKGDYKQVAGGSSFVEKEEFCILIVVVDLQTHRCDKIA